mgnify:CR=1 FL=1
MQPTAGRSPTARAAGATPAGVVISLDRQERGRGKRSAVQEVEDDLGLEVVSIISARSKDILILEDGEVMEYGERKALAADPESRLSHLLMTGMEEVLA